MMSFPELFFPDSIEYGSLATSKNGTGASRREREIGNTIEKEIEEMVYKKKCTDTSTIVLIA